MKSESSPLRILFFGSGIIGSVYALHFIKAGLDVTMLARGNRLKELKENGILYDEKGTVRRESVNVIEHLDDNDVYDFIFVPVRYDQSDDALKAIRNNKSKNIITLTNTVSYDKWTDIVGKRLIPGFPAAGGDIRDGVLYAQFAPKRLQGTVFGEISNTKTERIARLINLFESVGLTYKIPANIQAFHISHATAVVSNKIFYTDTGMMSLAEAKSFRVLKNMVANIKSNLKSLKDNDIPISDSMVKICDKLPSWALVFMYRMMLGTPLMQDALLGNHALVARQEVFQLDKAFGELMANYKMMNKIV